MSINKFVSNILFWLMTVGLLTPATAQNYGNEWINFSQSYYKIPIVQRGVHRLSYAQLQAAGVPVGAINPQRFQVFFRGVEQAILVAGEGDGAFDPTDYLEFYAEGNDGKLDTALYINPSMQVNRYYNLYSDTTACFFTWSNSVAGKRIPTFNGTPTTAETYHFQEVVQVFSDTYYSGQNYQVGGPLETFFSEFDNGEGWAGAGFSGGTSRDIVLNISNIAAPPGVNATLEVGIVSSAFTFNQVANISIGNSTSSLNAVGTISYSFAARGVLTQPVPVSFINSGSQVVVRVACASGLIGIAYIRLRYPQTLNMGTANAQYFITRATASTTATLPIANPPANPIVYDITDRNNLVNIAYSASPGLISPTINNALTGRRLYVYNAATFITPSSITPINFTPFNPASVNYLIVSHKQLRRPVAGSPDPVQEYANYRASSLGGGYVPLLMDIDVVYNQFSYGERTPLAIRNLVRFLYQNGSPRFMFLIGQSVCLPDRFNGLNIRQNAAAQALDLVPTGGWPPSDIVFSSGLVPSQFVVPAIPTGRLSVSQPQEVLNYLNKVREHEATGNTLWKKNFVLLSGGTSLAEQTTFKQYIDLLAGIAQGNFMRAITKTLSKRTAGTVELINIANEVNQGTGLVTFYGHSTREFTDIEIGFASDDIQGYRNKGKYPLMLANGCQLASIFYGAGTTLSEDWLKTPDRGALGFIAHTYIGYSLPLIRYSSRFFQVAYTDLNFLGQPIGTVQQELMRRYVGVFDQVEQTNIQQMLLQGDPAVRFTPGNRPDYAISGSELYLQAVDANPITATTDSFLVKIPVSNIGIADPAQQSFAVSIRRYFPDGSSALYTGTNDYPAVNYKDTLTFSLRSVQGVNAFGLNTFEVTIDFPNEVVELSKANNVASFDYFFPGVGVNPILPQEFAIVSEQPVALTATASGLQSLENRQIVFEIDTTLNFNSPIKQTQLQPAASVAIWNVTLLSDNSTDSTVYYWRVNFADAASDPNSLWGQSSFVYVRDSPPGWAQVQFPQFLKNQVNLLVRNMATRRLDFQNTLNEIVARTLGSTAVGNVTTDVFLSFNGLPLVFSGRCGNNVMLGTAFRQSNAAPYYVFGNSCGRLPAVTSNFNNTQITGGDVTNFINAVSNGDYVLLFSAGNVQFGTWTPAQRAAFGLIGANTNPFAPLASLVSGAPYIILGRKGAPVATATEIISGNIGNPTSDKISLQTNINIQVSEGTMNSTLIGPATQWRELRNRIQTFANDTYQLDLYGVSLTGQETLLLSNITTNSVNLSGISAQAYPYLRLRLRTSDAVTFTPVQLRNWIVLYEGVPEGFINVDLIGRDRYTISDRQEGDNFTLDFAFQNLSNLPFRDSVLVEYTFSNQTTGRNLTRTAYIKAPAAKEVVRFNLPIDTRGMAGQNQLRVFVNPRLQPEAYYENNILQVNFNVIRDNRNPTLEVAFDGRQIMDGEIVSPSPLISIRLRDDNRFLVLQDTTAVNIGLKRPCATCSFETITLSNPDVRWTSANGITEVNYNPKNLTDGIYTLRVQGKDASGNLSAVTPYQINFEVINESTVTNFFPYPNPFSSSTRFVFTLTGNEVPTRIKIQIMTVTGKVVREITQDELGPVRIGNNLSEYAWDGRDEFGDVLANGVYLYRVLLEGTTSAMGQRKTAGDKAFIKGYGKLYILR